MNNLFPAIEPYKTGTLSVSPLHTLYYEECGNPNGKPIVFLHGGPGAGCVPAHRQFFDPSFYRIILFDQRGCGRSTPTSELVANTTWDIVSDVEAIREAVGVDQWVVFGGSWGSTLALTYAINHPERVKGLILRGIFLGRQSENEWLYQQGAHNIYPDAWELYRDHIPAEERGQMIAAYYRRLTSDDAAVREAAAIEWAAWEGAISKLYPDPDTRAHYEDIPFTLAIARIECHYFQNDMFFPQDDYILLNTHRIQHIPTRIVQGRYDIVCPIRSAWDLKKNLPDADLRITPDAGHSAFEPGNVHELVQATEDFKKLA